MKNDKILLFFILFVILCSVSYAKVNQKITIMEFITEGTNKAFEFLAESIPQSLEIKLDKSTNLMIIRKYLWNEKYQLQKPIVSKEDAIDFGLKANIDGVIWGKIIFKKNEAEILIDITDVLKGYNLNGEKLNIKLNESLFTNIDGLVEPLKEKIISAFPQKDEKVVIKERKKIKEVYIDIRRFSNTFKIRLGFDNNAMVIGHEYSYNTPTTNVIKNYGVQGLYAELSYKYKFLEVGTKFSFGSSSMFKDVSSLEFKLGFWMFREIFCLYMGVNSYMINLSDYNFKINTLYPLLGFKLKPTESFIFGVAGGRAIGNAVRSGNPVQFLPGWDIDEMGGSFFVIDYEIFITSKIAVVFRMGANNLEEKYSLIFPNPTPPPDENSFHESYVYQNNFIDIGFCYKFEWGGGDKK